ncbi:MAG: MBL fold metallo-hydrolase [Lachnospiraceae bacterium]|nr:MBL fold metallo-hydrolase [Lachnospiraceae bacterium]
MLGMIGTNCYYIYDEESKKAIVIDPADNYAKLLATLNKLEIAPVAVLLTHGHFDHIMAADKIRTEYGIKVYIGEHEADVVTNPNLNLSAAMAVPASVKPDVLVKDNEVLDIEGITIKAIHTPGHTKGGMCYYLPKENVVFTGDTLFYESVGRTDFPTSSTSQLVRSIKDKLFELPDETICYPGHGDSTQIAYEKENNPFV